jgi:hypothetical protein
VTIVRPAMAASAALFALATLGGCATAHLRTANLAANSNVQALTAANTVYDTTLQTRLDWSSSQFWMRPGGLRVQSAALRAANAQDREYRETISALKGHADVLSRYFSMLADYTAPGTSSATTHTDAQLTAATTAANRIIALNEGLKDKKLDGTPIGNVVQAGLRMVLESVADEALRGHLGQHGQTIAEGMAIQGGAIRVVATQLSTYRSQNCDGALSRYEENASAPARARAADAPPYSPEDGQQFNNRRRPFIMCNREAADAVAAAEALEKAHQAYVDLIEGRLSPDAAALVLADAARAADLARALLN